MDDLLVLVISIAFLAGIGYVIVNFWPYLIALAVACLAIWVIAYLITRPTPAKEINRLEKERKAHIKKTSQEYRQRVKRMK